ncbi:MAG TPA: hypothetical protein PKA89_16840 [Phycicoccus sp.]|nr:hypothetical protein [Phycicoccus sp.]
MRQDGRCRRNHRDGLGRRPRALASHADGVELKAGIQELREALRVTLADIAEGLAGRAANRHGVGVVLVLGLADQLHWAAGAQVCAAAGGAVVALSAHVVGVDAGAEEPAIGRTNEETGRVLAESKVPRAAAVAVVDQMQGREAVRAGQEAVGVTVAGDVPAGLPRC